MRDAEEFRQPGFAIVPDLLTQREVAAVSRALGRVSVRGAGTRNLLDYPWCRALVQQVKRRIERTSVLSASGVGVQCTLFDKTPSQNWLVALHQDISIPVASRIEHPKLGAWSKKEGGHFVQPPLKTSKTAPGTRPTSSPTTDPQDSSCRYFAA